MSGTRCGKVPGHTRGFPGCPARLSGHRVDEATEEQEDHIGASAMPQPRVLLGRGTVLAGDDPTVERMTAGVHA
jgi:hypothetical protein